MCHPEVPEGQETPVVQQEEVLIPLTRGQGTMPALVCRPEGVSGPGVLVIGDIMGGRSPFYESLAARLATAGFTALIPEFFFRQGPLSERNLEAARARLGQLNQEQALSDLNAGINWLRSQESVTGDLTGTIGFCLGGTYGLHLAAGRQDIAGACLYGFPSPGPE